MSNAFSPTETASNLRTQWEGTDQITSRDNLELAVRYALTGNGEHRSDDEIDAIVEALSDLVTD